MSSAQRAYRFENQSYAQPAPSRSNEFSAQRFSKSQNSSSSLLVTAAKMVAVILVVITALSFIRIALTNASVLTVIECDAISSEIIAARTAGVSLEMEQTVLASNSAVKAASKRLGMGAPEFVNQIVLEPDVVATNEAGDLSLSGTVNNLIEMR